jgi:GxxExxY protein
MTELLLADEVYAVMGAAMDVYQELGPGVLEGVYLEALEIELNLRDIPNRPFKPLTVYYKGRRLKKEYSADFERHGQIIMELKALDRLGTAQVAQLLNYLKATGYRVGLLINFGIPGKLDWKRMVH